MKISVRVKPNSKQDSVEPARANTYIVRVKAKALEGKANEAVVTLLSEYFSVPKNNIVVVIGAKSRNKVIAIN